MTSSLSRWLFPTLMTFGMLTAHGTPFAYPDPTSDTLFPHNDLVELRAEVVAGELRLSLRYAGPLGLTDVNYGTLFIDGDLNPDTGNPLGADAVVDFVFSGVYTGGSISVGNRVIGLGQEGTVVAGESDAIAFRLPLALWGGELAPRVFATSGSTIATTFYDRVPDRGWLKVATGLAVVSMVSRWVTNVSTLAAS